MRRLALVFTLLITGAVTTFLASMLWVSLYAATNGGMAGQAAPGTMPDKPNAYTERQEDEGDAPSPEELDAALRSARREFGTEQSGLLLPVEGIAPSQLVDTYNAARSGGRSHGALDIMAPRGSRVIAAADGVVERLHQSAAGGITVYVRSPDNEWVYYYAHLDSYAPGLAAGQLIRRGDTLGLVGSTGNANPAWPHLHFALYRMPPGASFYQGRPVNPYPLLAGNARRR